MFDAINLVSENIWLVLIIIRNLIITCPFMAIMLTNLSPSPNLYYKYSVYNSNAVL